MTPKDGGDNGRKPAVARSEDLRAAFGPTLGQVRQRWRALVDRRLKAYGLTEATWRPLWHLAKFDSPPRQTDLAVSLGIEGPSLVRLLDALEQDGLIVRCGDSDRRSKIIRLTPRGDTLRRKIESVVLDVRRQVLAGISDRELAAAMRVLLKVADSVERAGRAVSDASRAGAARQQRGKKR